MIREAVKSMKKQCQKLHTIMSNVDWAKEGEEMRAAIADLTK